MPVLTRDMVPGLVKAGASCRADARVKPKLKSGDRIVVRNINPVGHTRLPRYVRGKRGMVERDHGVFVFPDTSAHGKGHKPQHVYSVRFDAEDLWGPQGRNGGVLYLDLWDDYLDKA